MLWQADQAHQGQPRMLAFQALMLETSLGYPLDLCMFPQETISFLQELADNNNREWFAADKVFIAIQNLPIASIHEQDFHKRVGRQFKTTAPLMKFLCDASDLMF